MNDRDQKNADEVNEIECTTESIPVADAIRAALDVAVGKSEHKFIVAVSGGRDSMALMHALARWFPESVAAIATFDHGSGPAATDAAALVAAEARRLGLTVIRERARTVAASEDAWRTLRWSFLKRVARGYRGVVATAHTRDDQVETIVMRQMRGAGARGLAALAAPSTIVRPWLPLSRQEVATWARTEGVPHVDDPTNFTRQYFRSRVRLDLLPALEAAVPGFAESMLSIGNAAARLRRDVDEFVNTLGARLAPSGSPVGSLRIPVGPLHDIEDAGLAIVWPALLARIGVALNRRGTAQLVRFAKASRVGMRLQLAGGACVLRVSDKFGDQLEMRAPLVPRAGAPTVTRSAGSLMPPRFGAWRFRVVDAPDADARDANTRSADAHHSDTPDAESLAAHDFRTPGTNAPIVERLRARACGAAPDVWLMPLAIGTRYDVRAWRDGDRIQTIGAPAGRRVARYLSEARVPTVDRRQWPVVLLDDEIVWVPGVCRGRAASDRPGRPAVIWYRCEREHG